MTDMNTNEPYSTPCAPDARKSPGDDLQREVDAAAKYGLFPPVDVEALADKPITMSVSSQGIESGGDLSSALEFIAKKLLPNHAGIQGVLFRGVDIARLGQITSSGCDAVPSTEIIFATDSAKKALEYGNLVMVFDPAKLERPFKDVLKSEGPEALRRLRTEYPVEKEIDENWLRFSKRPRGSGRIGTGNYRHYEFFIPGNPHEALLMIFLVGNDRDLLRADFLRCTELSLRHLAPSSGP